MKTTGKNQSRTTTKRSVTLRLDAFDYKCLELLALKNKYTISKQIALLLAASTATIRATVSEAELDEMITRLAPNPMDRFLREREAELKEEEELQDEN